MALDIVQLIKVTLGVLHTFFRFLPLGFYFFTYLTSVLFKDRRAAILLGGLVVNDLVGFSMKKYFKFEPNEACAIFGSKDSGKALGFLPNTHTEVIAFITAFFYSNMWHKYKFDLIPFVSLFFMVLLTAWSRVSIGCKQVQDVIFNIIVGVMLGMLYYYFTRRHYMKAEEEAKGTDKTVCDLGYDNYKCSEIRDGTVIMRDPEEKKKRKETPETDEDQGWYDTA